MKLKIETYKTIILPVVLYECETLLRTLREGQRLRVLEKRLFRIFRPKREEMVGGWRRLHNEELHNLQVSPNIVKVIKSRRMRWAGLITHMRQMRNAYTILVANPEGKKETTHTT